MSKSKLISELARQYVNSRFIFEETDEQSTEEMSCPVPATDVEVNTENRNAAIESDHIQYGPLNVDAPGDFWEKLADHWDTDVESAQLAICENCVAFDISPRMNDCMPGAVSQEEDGGKLGYCWMHHFKCHSQRTCRTWAKGGPITDNDVSKEWQSKAEA